MDPTAVEPAATAAKNFWALMGTVGDTFGGLSNFVLLSVAFYTSWWARAEVVRRRKQHAEEMRAAVAMSIFKATYCAGRDAHFLMMALAKYSVATCKTAKAEVDSSFAPFKDALAEAKLVFGEIDEALLDHLDGMRNLIFDALIKYEECVEHDPKTVDLGDLAEQLTAKLVDLQIALGPMAVLDHPRRKNA